MLIVGTELGLVEAELVGGLLGVRRVGGFWGRGGAPGAGAALPGRGLVVAAAAGAVPGLCGHACVVAAARVGASAG